ncbi:MAG: peptidase M14 [Lysobacteraceae bacterium]|nr:MAG: peptidase M14 [Xanthomonadaceae bacterium]
MHVLIRIAAALALLPTQAALSNPDWLPSEQLNELPSPQAFFGFEPGFRHLRHDQLLAYMKTLASRSDRVSIKDIGRTHEGRQLVHLYISAPTNLENLDQLREQHMRDTLEGPLVVWQGYSVHGNEASGSNAAPWFAWYLAASEDPQVLAMLEQTVVIVDPSINPDGLDRFASWVNTNASVIPNADGKDREHNETWPGGRTNHYWFDLNRDWLLLTQPSSRARVAQFQAWRPHVLTDFHEMGSNATYFFQPGVPSRRNPLTPQENEDLTKRLATYHAAALDGVGQRYYAEESFDDFYYGKGSSYPDAQGTIGILFEQSSARGHVLNTDNGERSLATGIRNQFTTSMSTLQGAWDNRDRLRQYQADFRNGAFHRPADGAWVVGDGGDPARLAVLVNVLVAHNISVYGLERDVTVDGEKFVAGAAVVVPRRQAQSILIESLFESRTEFPDATFYDVSTWNLPASHNLPFAASTSVRAGSEPLGQWQRSGQVSGPDGAPVAWAMPWNQYQAPRALVRLLAAGATLTVATKPFTAGQPVTRFDRGTVVAHAAADSDLSDTIDSIARSQGINFFKLPSGLAAGGVDLGSPSARTLKPVKPLLITGTGVSGYEAGEVWHLLDQRVGQSLTRVAAQRLPSVKLEGYTHILMVNGQYPMDSAWVEPISKWVRGGGTLVASKSASTWAEKALLTPATPATPASPQAAAQAENKEAKATEGEGAPVYRSYASYDADEAKQLVAGAVVRTQIDATHPLLYGYHGDSLPVFRNGPVLLQVDDNPYQTPVRYAEQPLQAGFMSQARREELSGRPAVIVNHLERGRIIRIADNMNFRAIWRGTERLYLNALYFSSAIDRTSVDKWLPASE